ncbi:hypothetical protein B9Z55_013189 [Caenorhabditis nigoni]|uniref:PAN-3 domain-containing protein n=1 Tax=Caenorhabditis nigoni TaxID=1611254 RepID=A0A2G5U1I3_9PELO|nr:hypothetical protein B9Z55_013189 [Caenorhabditis nigoni]
MKFLIILLLNFKIASNDHVMFEVYGKPNSLNDAQTIKNTEWSVCMSKCYSSEKCILAHNQNETCYMFNEMSMGTVTRTKPKDKSVVAFKANSTNGQCSKGPPSNMSELYSLNGTALSYNYSRSYCENQSAILTGLAYSGDVWYMLSKIRKMRDMKIESFYARIDGIRTKSCQATPKTKECMSSKGFEFTDKEMDSFIQHLWVTDSSAREKEGYDCLVLFSDKDNNNQIQTDVRRTVSNDHVMFEVYGKPNSLNDAQTINNTEWSVCMSKCYSSENCILAHNQNETCYMFNEVTMGTVTRTNPKDKSVVAFKANSTNGQCSTGPPSNMSVR